MKRPVPLRPLAWLGLDVLLVLGFAAAGRASHQQAAPVLGAVLTAWPFLVGTFVGWGVVRSLRRQWPRQVGPGITVWFATVVLGMVLRRVTGAGTEWPFVIVASVTLAVLLIGWRALRQWRRSRYAAHLTARVREPSRGAR
ncbi:MAG: DUF3054 domain-containing protein [Intrasporangium sp.]|uniref:DUF3054 domain-containing protein n=1 Tax=Intrasporangium sp. TaxID=1925024 RepID=UPI0026492480|nr:DUF3054 domain-containing protein [Intrasporangium sp.]MDN5794673.1 DUF3054 domain-containing protein [Intrasporangium sp.]